MRNTLSISEANIIIFPSISSHIFQLTTEYSRVIQWLTENQNKYFFLAYILDTSRKHWRDLIQDLCALFLSKQSGLNSFSSS